MANANWWSNPRVRLSTPPTACRGANPIPPIREAVTILVPAFLFFEATALQSPSNVRRFVGLQRHEEAQGSISVCFIWWSFQCNLCIYASIPNITTLTPFSSGPSIFLSFSRMKYQSHIFWFQAEPGAQDGIDRETNVVASISAGFSLCTQV